MLLTDSSEILAWLPKALIFWEACLLQPTCLQHPTLHSTPHLLLQNAQTLLQSYVQQVVQTTILDMLVLMRCSIN